MPIKIPESLPAVKFLEQEHIFCMDETRAMHQDIRPLRIVILNLMPKKIETETQLVRLLSNTPLQVELELIQTASHTSKNTPSSHLIQFYKTFADIRDQRFDGMIITGAPVEQIAFEEVDYWSELCEIMEWSKTHVYSTLHICWGAQAGLYYHYGIPKYPLEEKMFGIFPHEVCVKGHPLVRGFDDLFLVPHSRHTEVREGDIRKIDDLCIVARSPMSGVHMITSRNGRQVFVTGHSEYDSTTLAEEYFRDRDKGLTIQIPYHYFPENDPSKVPPLVWRAHANLFFTNWLNYFVYQVTPFDLEQLPENR